MTALRGWWDVGRRYFDAEADSELHPVQGCGKCGWPVMFVAQIDGSLALCDLDADHSLHSPSENGAMFHEHRRKLPRRNATSSSG